jgi:hypothetical protein
MVIEAQVKINQESAEKMLEDMKRDKKYWIITKIKFELEPEGQSD